MNSLYNMQFNTEMLRFLLRITLIHPSKINI